MAWLTSQSLLTRVVQFLGQILLAWLLVPGEFGAVGLALTITSLVSAVFAFGTTDVLIQRRRAIRLWASPAFWLNAALSCVGFALALAAAPVAERAYGTPGLALLVCVAAAAMPVEALGSVPGAILRARLRFRTLAVAGMAEIVAVQVLAVGFAWAGLGALSIVLPPPLVALVRVAYLWKASGMRVRLGASQRRWRMLVSRSTAVLSTRFVVAAVAQGDYVILGLVANDAAVGLYYFAFKIAILPVFSLAGSLTNVLAPALVQLSHDPRRQAEVALSVVRLLNLVVMPVCFLQAAVAQPVLEAFFPAKWAGSIPLVQALSIGLAFDASGWATGALMGARGEFRRQFRFSASCAPVFFALAGGIGWGMRGSDPALGVALGVAAYYASMAPLCASIVLLKAGAARRDVSAAVGGTAALSAASILLPWAAARYAGLSGMPAAVATGAAAVVLHLGMVRTFFPADLADIVGRLRKAAGPKRPAAVGALG